MNLEPLLGRRDRRAVFNGRTWTREQADPAGLLDQHFAGELLLGAVHGGEPTTQLIAWDIDGGSHRGAFEPRGAVRALTDVICLAGLPAPLVATSKSGDGFHAYVLFAEPVDTAAANQLARALKDRAARPEIDRVYPSGPVGDGLVLGLPGCGINGAHPVWLAAGGSRVCQAVSLSPLPHTAQAEALESWPRCSAAVFERAVARLETKPTSQPVPVRPQWHRPLPVYRTELDTLAEECDFVKFCGSYSDQMSYEEWFSLATVLAVFPGGAQLFDAISSTDSKRYRAREIERKLSSIRGAPRYCTNLGWHCSKLSECGSLGVRSPAGLPYKLKRVRRSSGAA